MTSNNPDGRPKKYEYLGERVLMRVPKELEGELRELFRQLDRSSMLSEGRHTDVLRQLIEALDERNNEIEARQINN